MGCMDKQRVLFSSFLMEDRAKDWWDAVERRYCHAPDPGPTQLANPNRFPGRETQDWDSLPDFFFSN